MWSFVGSKNNRQWIWLAIDEQSAEIVGVCVGARDRGGAEALWASLPAVYRQCAVAYTDFWSSYEEIFPASRHRAVGKETGGTSKMHVITPALMMGMEDIILDRISFGGMKELQEMYE